ncbi:class I adenylate-forming enzyme family protein [Eilatimonas milleporae]|uniref:3-methylmercaptopropionyl-CoA ligase n=1 Tax=Eilatimonas milleporae TaxID=911205 RepID=A0A3M0CLG9_9PROT|nr:class I adenylate-forming enzyme family protein [Eilatimonas milleporae]RMB07919.1 long-chain acyl-CoA synthetase [Eilatimonas milleporae]
MAAPLPDGFTHLDLSRAIRTAAVRVPEKPALVCDRGTLTYRQLTTRMDRVGSAAVRQWGLRAGDVVAVIAPNRLEYLEVVAGLSDRGVVVATLNPRMAAPELSVILADCQPRAVLIDPALDDLAETVRAAGVPLIAFGPAYDALLREAVVPSGLPVVPEWASFSLCYTSGTTGAPKGVMLSHRSRALMVLAMGVEYGCFGMDDRFLALAPLYHGAGFVFAVAALSFGGTCLLFNASDPEAIVRRIAEGDVTGVFMVPTHFKRIFDLPERAFAGLADRHRLKAVISNAAALPQRFKEATCAHFGSGLLHETYGSTEGGIVTNIRPADIMDKPGSVGTPFIHMEVAVRREDGTLCAPGEIGELFCRGPYSFNGYLNRPSETAETLRDGWVTVQDLAHVDGDGFITIDGRKKDMVVSGGVNIYPVEIEAVIARQPGVAEVAVVGLPDPEWGERLHAFIVPESGRPVSEAGVLSACRENLAGYKVPRGMTFMDALPRNTSGKLLKRTLREGITTQP